MRNFLFALMLVAVSLLGYGYYDAYSPQKVESNISGRIVSAFQIPMDVLLDYDPVKNSDLFIKLTWTQPSDVYLVSGIEVYAKIYNGSEMIDKIKAPCMRVGSKWLAREFFANGDVDLECFVKINKQLPGYEGVRPTYDVAKNEAAKLKLEYWVKVEGVNRPLRYIAWINNALSKVYGSLTAFVDFLKSPFQRA